MSFKVINVEAACGTSVGAASTFNDSTEVRLVKKRHQKETKRNTHNICYAKYMES